MASGRHAVGGGDRERVGAAAARRGCAGQRGRAVAVVHERHARGQRPVSVSAEAGKPVVVTVNVPGVPVVECRGVIAGDRRRLAPPSA